MPANQRQEVFNVLLAQLLQERGAIVAPESILYTGTQRTRQMPDVIVSYQGLRTAIEGEVEAPNAQEKALASALHRVETGVAHIGVGVVYPASLRTVDFAKLKDALAQATLEITVTTEAGSTGFTKGDVDYLERALRSTFEQLIREDVVAESVALLDVAVDQFAAAALTNRGNWGRISHALSGSKTDVELDQLTDTQRGANCRIGGLVLINAMIFHDILSGHYTEVTPLANIISQKKIEVFADEWQYVLEEINFYSIFHLAREIFINVSRASWGIPEALALLVETALKISERRAALRHDLMGRVYHRLLAEAKFLGTYYTSIPAATLLLKLALRPEAWSVKWDDVNQVAKLRIADLSCGTGTLLMASADTLIDNHVSAAAGQGSPVELEALHRQTAESILYGYDVLPSAVHLTASTLALRLPDVPFRKMNLFCLPFGGPESKLGSIEFLRGRQTQMTLDLFGSLPSATQVTGQSDEELSNAPLPDLDLCVMNPPFVSSRDKNKLFGSLPEDQRGKSQKRLKKLISDSGMSASVTSGLGSVFVAIGDRYLKPGGRIALVLPAALLSGVSWQKTRDLINSRYHLEFLVSSHDSQRWNFSDSTNLSEVLIIAARHGDYQDRPQRTVAVNLRRNPTTALEALALVSQLANTYPPDINTQGALELRLGDEKVGEAISLPAEVAAQNWLLPCTYAQADLVRALHHLLKGILHIPGYQPQSELPLCQLSELGTLGPDIRDVHDGFVLTKEETQYPTFWNHDHNAVKSIGQEPNGYLSPLARPKKGRRNLRRVETLWPKSASMLNAERLRLNTHRLACVRVSSRVLSNTWWEFKFHPQLLMSVDSEKALSLWLNSTLAIIMLCAHREVAHGAWGTFKKPTLLSMPVVDLRRLTAQQIATLARSYDELCELELKSFAEMASDDTRAKIDCAIADALNLSDFSALRTMLSREPVVTSKRI